MTRQIVLRFPPSASQEYAATRADIAAFQAWSWSGPEEVPAVVEIEGHIRPGQGFGISAVRYTPEDAEACLKSLELATRIVPVDYEIVAKEKAAREAEKARKRQISERLPDQKPSPREQVPPSLRWALSEEVKEEGRRFGKYSENFRGRNLLTLVDRLGEWYPHIARLDECLDGSIRQCLRAAAEVRTSDCGPYPWTWIATPIALGWPQNVRDKIDWAMRTMATFPRLKAVAAKPTPAVRRVEGTTTYFVPDGVTQETLDAFPSADIRLAHQIAANAIRDGIDPNQALREWTSKASAADCPF